MTNSAYMMKTAGMFIDDKGTLEALRNTCLLWRNDDIEKHIVSINLLRIENYGLLKLIIVNEMLEGSRPLFINIIILYDL